MMPFDSPIPSLLIQQFRAELGLVGFKPRFNVSKNANLTAQQSSGESQGQCAGIVSKITRTSYDMTVLSKYNPKNLFNSDDTLLLFKMSPNLI